jgi:hypothetical protein
LFLELQILYLDSSGPNVSLGIFLGFLGFSDYFSCFKLFFGLFLKLLMHWKLFRKKTYPIGLDRAPGPDPTCSGPAARPAKAHRQAGHGRRRHRLACPRPCPAPIKASAEPRGVASRAPASPAPPPPPCTSRTGAPPCARP